TPRAKSARRSSAFTPSRRRGSRIDSATSPRSACPALEGCGRDPALPRTRADVHVVADAVEPLEHQRVVGAALAHLLDGHGHELDLLLHGLAEDAGRLRHRELVARDIELAAVERRRLLEHE